MAEPLISAWWPQVGTGSCCSLLVLLQPQPQPCPLQAFRRFSLETAALLPEIFFGRCLIGAGPSHPLSLALCFPLELLWFTPRSSSDPQHPTEVRDPAQRHSCGRATTFGIKAQLWELPDISKDSSSRNPRMDKDPSSSKLTETEQ